MKLIKNVSPFGDVDSPLLGRSVEAGAVIEVTDEQAFDLLFQPLHWEAADAPAIKAAKASATPKDGE